MPYEKLLATSHKATSKNPQDFRESALEVGKLYEGFADGTVKDITDEVPFEIPESWEWARLGVVSTYADTKKKVNAKDANPVLWGLDLEDIEKGGKLLVRLTVGERKSIGDKTYFESGDILYSKLRPYLLKVLVADEDGVCTPEIVPFKMYGSINPHYIVAYLKSPYVNDTINSATYGIKMPRAGTETMTGLFVPVPPLSEQNRIVERIKELAPFIAKYNEKEGEIANLNAEFPDLLKKSILQQAVMGKLVPQDESDEPARDLLKRIREEKDALIKAGKLKKNKHESIIYRRDNSHYEKVDGEEHCIDEELSFSIPESWELIRLNDIGDYRKGPFGSSLTKSMFIPKREGSIKVYEQKNAIQKDHTLGSYYIQKQYYEDKMSSFTVEPGDIIVSCAGTIGETYIMPDDIELGIINQALMRMRIYAPINIQYFLLYFDYVIKQETRENSKGSAIKNIPPFEIFKRILLPLPPLEEQARIVKRVSKLMDICDQL